MQVDNSDLLLAPIGGVNLASLRNEFEASDTGNPANRFNHFVCLHVDHVQNPWSQVSRKQKLLRIVSGQVVEPLALGTGEIDRRNLFKGLALQRAPQDKKSDKRPSYSTHRRVRKSDPTMIVSSH